MLIIVGNESGFNPEAQNRTSTAYGLFQFLDTTWTSYGCQKTINFREQIECGIKYVAGHHGSPSKALAFWNTLHEVNGKMVHYY